VTLVLFAASREVEAAGSGDHRYAEAAEAADAIKRIAGTPDQVDDAVLLRLSAVNLTSEGLLSASPSEAWSVPPRSYAVAHAGLSPSLPQGR
jgi:hypothetical protein